MFESVRRRLQCNPLCLAMLNRTKTLYIDVLRFPPPDFKVTTVDMFKLRGRRLAMNTTHRASMQQQNSNL